MRLLKGILAVLTARWFLTLVGAAVLAALIWYFGPLLAVADQKPLVSDFNRLLAILGITLLWGVSNLWSLRRSHARGQALVEAVAKPAAGVPNADVAAVAARFKDAMDRLKVRRFSKGRLYQLPWYLMIGPPGSGKTTALLQSGLRFPLDTAQELKGVGGTRNCDWFFTDEAVLLDTAGRWTTQDSDRSADEAAWTGFLDLLKRYRPREPINGVIVALGADELASANPAALEETAQAVRRRLAELGERLGLSLPVYLLLTKADLVAGFREMFADLDERQREQVWGFTLPLAAPGAPPPAAVSEELGLLVDRLESRTLGRIEAERSSERRAAVQAFPPQIAALASPLQRFLESAFASTGYETPPVVRGIYFTSGTQAGSPIDRLLAELQRGFGLRVGPARPLDGNRSFFLTRLLREVVFAEAPLVRRASRLERSERRWAALAWGSAGLAVLLLLGGWAWSYRQQIGAVRSYAGSLQSFAAQTNRLSGSAGDVREVLPTLQAAEALTTPAPPGPFGLGLSQAGRLRSFGEETYRNTLDRIFLPPLLSRVEAQLRAQLTAPEAAAETLKVYLALGGPGELSVPMVTNWFAADWTRAYPLDDGVRNELQRQLAALLEELPPAEARPPLDGALIASALAAIDRLPLSKRAYAALVERHAGDGEPFLPLQVAGPEATALFAATAAPALQEPIPALFTRGGFWRTFLPGIPGEAQKVLSERAALQPGAAGGGEREQARIVREMLDLYYADAIDRWQRVERALGFRLPGNMADAAAVLRPLAVPPSPLARLLQGMAAATRLTEPPAAPPDAGTAVQALAQVQIQAGAVLQDLLTRAGQPGPPLGQPVQARFAALALAVAGENGAPAPLDRALQAANEVYLALPPGGVAPTPAQASQVRAQSDKLASAAAGLPPPVKEPLIGLASRLEGIAGGQVLSRINDEYRAKVMPFCRQALADRFPFDLGSTADVSLGDMARLFAAGGLFDQFAEQQLAPFVDMAKRPWQWLQPIGSSSGALAQFELARRLRDGLFAGGAVPRAGFTLEPAGLDASSGKVVLDLDGQQVTYAHGPIQPTHVDWPGPSGSRLVRLTFVPVGGGTPAIVTKQGPWAWFRLLHEATLASQGQPDRFGVTFGIGAHSAGFDLLADSVDNPFSLELFQQFRCPGGL
ncbi:MAG: type VI secretion system membrane subunit TssM [Geminicoccaceae bacterium]